MIDECWRAHRDEEAEDADILLLSLAFSIRPSRRFS